MVKSEKEKKKNPMWDKLFEDERLSGEIDKSLPEFLQVAIKHERKCIKYRLKQIESYLNRLSKMQAGMDYFDTFKELPVIKGVPFPNERYLKLRDEFEDAVRKAKHERKKKKKDV